MFIEKNNNLYCDGVKIGYISTDSFGDDGVYFYDKIGEPESWTAKENTDDFVKKSYIEYIKYKNKKLRAELDYNVYLLRELEK